jgi:SNF2 family DNA or RNA helicase
MRQQPFHAHTPASLLAPVFLAPPPLPLYRAQEMGLGKTVQSMSFLEHLRTREGVRGPFLVIAPLSTLGHWKRECEDWTEMNCVYYHDPAGGSDARDMIRQYEWYYNSSPDGRARAHRLGLYKFHVLVTSYHVFMADHEYLKEIRWRAVVVDEAHALKNVDSQLQSALGDLRYDHLLLLTGTPLQVRGARGRAGGRRLRHPLVVTSLPQPSPALSTHRRPPPTYHPLPAPQNEPAELWALLHLVDKAKYPSAAEFAARYNGLRTPSDVERLQRDLGTMMLRRVKEDVEKSIPPKEETLIHVELTRLQKAYYRAIFERNRGFLSRGTSSAPIASLVNIEMELRKCCNHPFLLRGAELRETAGAVTRREKADCMVAASGKMVLLDKLLPKLHAEGHRLLLFSQFKGLLSLLEELLATRGYKYERLDGSVRGNERQAAIDRFNKPGSDVFAFLLSTKAGGQGINLVAADTVIIYDSDWNPQNDMQVRTRVVARLWMGCATVPQRRALRSNTSLDLLRPAPFPSRTRRPWRARTASGRPRTCASTA